MIPGFGKQSITVGSAPSCDVVLAGEGVLPEHARIVHQGGGQLFFINGGGRSTSGGRALGQGEQVPFDLRTTFQVGSITNVPLNHPSITLMLMATGQGQAQPGQITIGRDPTRASLVIQHPSVSSFHATVMLDRMMVVDNQSTSGTYVGPQRIPPNAPTPLEPNGILAFGPVPVQVQLLMRLGQAMRDPAARASIASGPPAMQSGAHAAVVATPGPPQAIQPGTAIVAAPHPGQISGQMPVPQVSGQMPVPQVSGQMQAVKAAPNLGGQQAALKKNKTILGSIDFSRGGVKTIGRTPNNDIVIAHPQVSSNHALLHQIAGQYFVEDKGSANGTYVRGARIPPGQKIAVAAGEKIYIGPMPLHIEGGAGGGVEVVQEQDNALEQWAGKPLYDIEAWSLVLEVPDRDDPGRMKSLLDNVSFKALPGDMIALMGPSGAGKTTLLLTLNGYLPPSSGIVRVNGEDLYNIYDTLRGSIGYVPQDDLVHPELTVFEAVKYSAKFRLPPDFSEDEIDQRVEQTIKDLGLEGVKNLQIGRPEKKILSGGQRKRVNIALELVTDPVIVFLDEPTSGLAADDTTALIQLLSDLTKRTGKTIIMTIHQPAKDEFEKFTHALIMGYGGVPMFFGPTKDAYKFFGTYQKRAGGEIDNPRDMFDAIAVRERPMFEAMRAQNPYANRSEARKAAALEWRQEFYRDDNPIYRKMYSGRREIGSGEGARGVPPSRPTTSGQMFLLLSRYFKVKVRDTSGILIMLLQAPIIGILLAGVFRWQAEAIPAWCLGAMQDLSKRAGDDGGKGPGADVLSSMLSTSDHTGAVFFLVVSAVWFGTSNAAREIVSERAIYLRERMVNLGLFNYVFSKYLLLAFFCIVQCTMLLGIVFTALGFHGGMNAFFMELAALVATSLSAVALGLLLSTIVTSSEAAMALTPIALIPQVVLGGLMVPSTTAPHLKWVMFLVPARWGFEGAIQAERTSIETDAPWVIDFKKPDLTSAPDFIHAGKFKCAIAQLASDQLPGAWGFTTYQTFWLPYAVLGGMTFITLVVLCVILKRRDPV